MSQNEQTEAQRAKRREGIDDEQTIQDEMKPKDGASIVTADAGQDDEAEDMPTGLPKKQGFEDYNPAARPHTQAGDAQPEAAGP